MKKLLTVVLSVLLTASLVSCGNADSSDIYLNNDLTSVTDTTTAESDTDSSELTEADTSKLEEQTSVTTKHTEHVFVEWKEAKKAGCTTGGTQERKCLMCGYTEIQQTPALGHSFGEWQITKAPTCVEQGTMERVCTVCGEREEGVAEITGHSFGGWQTTREATYESSGERYHTCGVCGYTETETIPIKVLTDADKQAMAREVAQQIANSIDGATDLEKVTKAAQIVSWYSSQCQYTMEGRDYATAYGVFIKGEYSCAGSTRALGLVLECMGYQWTHANENQYTHQWCILTMDGQVGFADGQVGWAGYGKHPVAE